uniref:AlNc14C179G8176 protein n=1 Tax=Albugo laibachii Nc14 TaxID=890382 RepID=F0WEK8_9STRA|nr:AlNc14C75G5058 [Albugo laibachii Nc14]CCA23072.1 AlNc14C179G8176 [Albugo laibachii Nc14]|eukprot:CCA23072.1 AlNc14C179G8176 [Albugo laibachii Nc14]
MLGFLSPLMLICLHRISKDMVLITFHSPVASRRTAVENNLRITAIGKDLLIFIMLTPPLFECAEFHQIDMCSLHDANGISARQTKSLEKIAFSTNPGNISTIKHEEAPEIRERTLMEPYSSSTSAVDRLCVQPQQRKAKYVTNVSDRAFRFVALEKSIEWADVALLNLQQIFHDGEAHKLAPFYDYCLYGDVLCQYTFGTDFVIEKEKLKAFQACQLLLQYISHSIEYMRDHVEHYAEQGRRLLDTRSELHKQRHLLKSKKKTLSRELKELEDLARFYKNLAEKTRKRDHMAAKNLEQSERQVERLAEVNECFRLGLDEISEDSVSRNGSCIMKLDEGSNLSSNVELREKSLQVDRLSDDASYHQETLFQEQSPSHDLRTKERSKRNLRIIERYLLPWITKWREKNIKIHIAAANIIQHHVKYFLQLQKDLRRTQLENTQMTSEHTASDRFNLRLIIEEGSAGCDVDEMERKAKSQALKYALTDAERIFSLYNSVRSILIELNKNGVSFEKIFFKWDTRNDRELDRVELRAGIFQASGCKVKRRLVRALISLIRQNAGRCSAIPLRLSLEDFQLGLRLKRDALADNSQRTTQILSERVERPKINSSQ